MTRALPELTLVEEPSRLTRLKPYWAPAFGYAVLVSGLFLHGYWLSFGVQPLEYIGTSDILKIAAFPLGVVFAIYLAAIAAGAILGVVTGAAEWLTVDLLRRLYRMIAGRRRKPRAAYVFVVKLAKEAKRVLLKWSPALLAGIPLIHALSATDHEVAAWGLALTSIVGACGLVAANSKTVRAAPRKVAKVFAVALALLLLFLALDAGISRAERTARADHTTTRIDIERSELKLVTRPDKPVVYLGLLDKTHFLYESATGRIVSIGSPTKGPLFFIPPSSEPADDLGPTQMKKPHPAPKSPSNPKQVQTPGTLDRNQPTNPAGT